MSRQCRQVPIPQPPHLGVAHQRVGSSWRRGLRREVVRMLPCLLMFKSLRASTIQELPRKQLPEVGKLQISSLILEWFIVTTLRIIIWLRQLIPAGIWHRLPKISLHDRGILFSLSDITAQTEPHLAWASTPAGSRSTRASPRFSRNGSEKSWPAKAMFTLSHNFR